MNNDYIELLIKVPKEIYKHTQEYEVGGFNTENGDKLFMVIKNGTPLPKGHGKIVDIKPLMIGLYEGMGKETFTPIEVYKMLDEECQVIIEADKEGAEE